MPVDMLLINLFINFIFFFIGFENLQKKKRLHIKTQLEGKNAQEWKQNAFQFGIMMMEMKKETNMVNRLGYFTTLNALVQEGLLRWMRRSVEFWSEQYSGRYQIWPWSHCLRSSIVQALTTSHLDLCLFEKRIRI